MPDHKISLENGFNRFTTELLPAGLPAALQQELHELARPLAIGRKRSFTLETDANHLLFLISGAVKLVASSPDGGEQVLSFKFAGDCMHVPRAKLHAFSLVAMRRSEALLFPADAVHALAAGNAALAHALCECTLNALYHCRENLLTMGRRGATERVASFLLAMCDIRQVIDTDGRTLNLLMTRREIADCLGLTVETVSRQFSKLRELKLIDTPSRTIVKLNDRARLAVYAGGLESPT